jgi:hypothetical protein
VAARDAALPDRIGPGHICRCCAAQDMRLRQICLGFRAGIRAFPGGIHLTVADWPVLLARAWSDREIGLDPAEVVPGQGQVRLRPLEHQVEEEAQHSSQLPPARLTRSRDHSADRDILPCPAAPGIRAGLAGARPPGRQRPWAVPARPQCRHIRQELLPGYRAGRYAVSRALALNIKVLSLLVLNWPAWCPGPAVARRTPGRQAAAPVVPRSCAPGPAGARPGRPGAGRPSASASG